MADTFVPQWTLQDRLRKARIEAGLDQQAVADRLFVSRRTVVRWENGETVPNADMLKLFAEAIGVDPVWLFVGEAA